MPTPPAVALGSRIKTELANGQVHKFKTVSHTENSTHTVVHSLPLQAMGLTEHGKQTVFHKHTSVSSSLVDTRQDIL